MNLVLTGFVCTGLVPLGLALWANRRTSLAHSFGWAMIAWGSWAPALFLERPDQAEVANLRYVALSLTACAGVAVLGARRPNVLAWNFVLLGLFAVMLLPLLEMEVIGSRSTEGLRTFFLAATLAVGILNYVPTRLTPAALLLLVACEAELIAPIASFVRRSSEAQIVIDGGRAAVPWLAWICWRRRPHPSPFDGLWLDFRDRWGVVWSQRVREQFNHASRNAGWSAVLGWGGLEIRPADDDERYVNLLRSILQRFLVPDHHP